MMVDVKSRELRYATYLVIFIWLCSMYNDIECLLILYKAGEKYECTSNIIF